MFCFCSLYVTSLQRLGVTTYQKHFVCDFILLIEMVSEWLLDDNFVTLLLDEALSI